MQNLTTWDLGTLENSFGFLEDLPTGKIWNVELNDNGDLDNFFYRDERNAKARFDTLVNEYDLDVKNEHEANDGFWTSVWMGEIYFND